MIKYINDFWPTPVEEDKSKISICHLVSLWYAWSLKTRNLLEAMSMKTFWLRYCPWLNSLQSNMKFMMTIKKKTRRKKCSLQATDLKEIKDSKQNSRETHTKTLLTVSHTSDTWAKISWSILQKFSPRKPINISQENEMNTSFISCLWITEMVLSYGGKIM